MNIPLTPVKSSQIKAVGYDGPSSTLALQFKAGAIYHYKNVPNQVHQDLVKAESIGQYFTVHIKSQPALYPYQKQTV